MTTTIFRILPPSPWWTRFSPNWTPRAPEAKAPVMLRAERPRALLRLTRDARAQYVVINLGVNLLFLLRSYVFMLVLDYRDLGLVALLQSVVLLLGILQFGVLNGGYRLLLSADEAERRAIVDFVYSFIVVLAVGGLVAACLALPYVDRPQDGVMAILGVVGGGATLVRTWQTNQMIAAGKLGLLNAVNLGSSLFSLALLGFIPQWPLLACMAAVVAQPLLFAIAGWLTKGADRPHGFNLNGGLACRILATGFVIFLAGMLLQVNVQLERWYVTAELGIAALGHLFVAIMFVTLLQLVPTALDAIFLPSAVRARQALNDEALARTVRNYLLLLLGYAAISAVAVAFLARPVLTILAPRYVPDLVYLYLITPGALMLAASSAFALTFSVLIRYRWLLVAYGCGTLALALVFGMTLAFGGRLSLAQVTVARSGALGLTALLVVAGWWLQSRGEPGLRMRGRAAAPSD
jgi:O-antigen/teichoic acid export membrane protein